MTNFSAPCFFPLRRAAARLLLTAALAGAACCATASAQTVLTPVNFEVTAPASYSSSSASAAGVLNAVPAAAQVKPTDMVSHVNRPLRSVALAAKAGVNGVGFDLATPLAHSLTLRGGAQFFDHDLNPNANGIHSFGELTLQNVQASVDIFPFRSTSFHISPGVTLHNDNHLFSSLFVPAGATFSLGGDNYISDPNAPITGSARVKFGNKVAPRITVGWGSMLPRSGGHFSVPFEFGFQYISSPTLDLMMFGNACDMMGNCGDINDTAGPQDLQKEIHQLNQDISTLRFYPIMSIGVSYKFGH